jgi:hypothetical protein
LRSPGARYSGHPRQLLLRCSTSCIPAVVPSTPSGPSSLRCDVQIRSRRICQPLGHLSGGGYFIHLGVNLKPFPAGRVYIHKLWTTSARSNRGHGPLQQLYSPLGRMHEI